MRLAVKSGLSAITVQAVSSAAEVTKGGFLHHFPSKQALIDAIFDEVLDILATEIKARASKDAVAYGAFTRAYADLAFGDAKPGMSQTWIALSILMLDDQVLREKWANWLGAQLEIYSEDEADTELGIVRLAVDGAWLAQHVRVPIPERKDMLRVLTERTMPKG